MKSLDNLRPSGYQLVPLTKLLRNGQNALLICDGVGVGKTISAGYILTYLTLKIGRPGLVVCPPGLQEKWQLELRDKFQLRTYAIRNKEELHFATDDWDKPSETPRVNILSSSLLQTGHAPQFLGPIIFDEIHNYRNRKTKIWQSAKALAQRASHRVGLSATPINNSVDDLASELSILLNLSVDVVDALVSDLWRPERQHLMYVMMTRFSKEKLGIHFAHRNVHDLEIEFPEEYSSQVAAGIKLLRERPKSEKIFLDEITYFRLGASSPRAFSRSTKIAVMNATQKLKALDEILSHHKWSQVIVFCEFEATAEDIANSVTERPSFLITGSVPVVDRNSILAQFRNAKTGVLVLTSVGAEGLDLQFCSALINFDLTWNPMVLEQRIGRIDRIGQGKSSIDIYNFVVAGSIDARIIKTLGRKLGLIENSILEPRTVLGSTPTANFGNLETTEIELELDKANVVARAVELANQIIPDDYELAKIIGEDACDLEHLRSLAISKSKLDWTQEFRSTHWLEKMIADSSVFATTVGHYAV